MEDGEGRYIDFKNTVIILTSNVGTERIMDVCKDPELMPDAEGLTAVLRINYRVGIHYKALVFNNYFQERRHHVLCRRSG